METAYRHMFQIALPKFLPYLWGMETTKKQKTIIAFNFLFLPYLWGMETFSLILEGAPKYGSYHTYEEWKPRKISTNY